MLELGIVFKIRPRITDSIPYIKYVDRIYGQKIHQGQHALAIRFPVEMHTCPGQNISSIHNTLRCDYTFNDAVNHSLENDLRCTSRRPCRYTEHIKKDISIQ